MLSCFAFREKVGCLASGTFRSELQARVPTGMSDWDLWLAHRTLLLRSTQTNLPLKQPSTCNLFLRAKQ